jgi:hypothetical protein
MTWTIVAVVERVTGIALLRAPPTRTSEEASGGTA